MVLVVERTQDQPLVGLENGVPVSGGEHELAPVGLVPFLISLVELLETEAGGQAAVLDVVEGQESVALCPVEDDESGEVIRRDRRCLFLGLFLGGCVLLLWTRGVLAATGCRCQQGDGGQLGGEPQERCGSVHRSS